MMKAAVHSQTDKTTAQRRDEALRRALSALPKPHEDMKLGKGKKKKKRKSSATSSKKA